MGKALSDFDWFRAFSLTLTIGVGVWLIKSYTGVDPGLRDFGLICLGTGLGITGASRVTLNPTPLTRDGE